jgi:hypothetical protein
LGRRISEHRSTFRYRTNRLAKIYSDSGRTIECIVCDLSTRGARLEVADAKQIPDNFFLIIQGMSDRFQCHVVWKNGNMIGVEYL